MYANKVQVVNIISLFGAVTGCLSLTFVTGLGLHRTVDKVVI